MTAPSARHAPLRPARLAGATVLALVAMHACGDGGTEPAPPDPPRPTAVTVSPATAQLTALGATAQLSAEVRDQNGSVMAGATVRWSSNAAAVAAVDGPGLVTAAGNGTATITAMSGSASGSAAVTVAQEVAAVTVSPAADTLVAFGDTMRLSAEAMDANGHPAAGVAFTWTSGDTMVAVVDSSGLVAASGNGTATITAMSGSASGSAAVTVVQEVAAVAVTSAADTLVAGDTLRLAAEAADANGHTVAGAEFAWASSDTRVAVVDPSGLVTGVGAGMVEITATSSGVTGRAELTIAAREPATIDVNPDSVAFTALGQGAQLAAEVRDQIGRLMEGVRVSWSSADTTVAAVNSVGLVTATGAGATTMRASAGEAFDTAVVTVMQSVGSVAVSPAADRVTLGDTLRLAAEAFDANGHAVEDADFTWSSSNLSVAAVDASGLVTGRAEGRATITAMAGEASGTAEITVENPDRTALAAFYRATDGRNWDKRDGWLTDAPLGNWHGVTVDRGGRVVGLQLARNGLKGRLPPLIGTLEHLETLELNWNGLTGAIPAALGTLARLRVLDLRSNEFVGPIPPELVDLTRLQRLHLLYAGIAGELCVPDHPRLVSWLSRFSMAPGAPARASFFPCDRDQPSPPAGLSVRVLYAIPSDREFNQEYSDGIRRAVELLQWWYAEQLDGPTFTIHNAEPEPCYLREPESFYLQSPWRKTFEGVQYCAPVWHDRAEFTSIVYVDIWHPSPLEVVLRGGMEDCYPAEIGAGTLGLTILPAKDLHGLITPLFSICGFETGIDRWIGGLGHELGHALGLPHPPGCEQGLPSCDENALMWWGYYDWPHTYLREDEKAALLKSPFIR